MAKAGDTGDGCGSPACKWGTEHLGNASYKKHDTGHVETYIIENKEPTGHQLVVGYGMFQDKHQESCQNTENKIVRVNNRTTDKTVLPVKSLNLVNSRKNTPLHSAKIA